MVKFTVAIAILVSCIAASALPQTESGGPDVGIPPIIGSPIRPPPTSSENWCITCGTIIGTTECPEKGLKCCYLMPDYGVCLPYCPEDLRNPLARRELELRNMM